MKDAKGYESLSLTWSRAAQDKRDEAEDLESLVSTRIPNRLYNNIT